MIYLPQRITPPFRAEVVGSFLRPEALDEAYSRYKNGEIDHEALEQAQNEAIARLVSEQHDNGLDFSTEGGYRRTYWHLDFFWDLNGVKRVEMSRPYMYNGVDALADSACLDGRVAFNPDHHIFRQFNYLKSVTPVGMTPRQAIPSPAQLFAELTRGENAAAIDRYYSSRQALADDIAAAYRETLATLYTLGCRSVMMDDCVWGMFCDSDLMAKVVADGHDIDAYKRLFLSLNNDAMRDIPDDMVVATRVYHGYFHSSWHAGDGYKAIADTFFAHADFDAFYLRFDPRHPADFESLSHIPDDKLVVLGLISTRNPELEDKQMIIDAINEAARYVPLDRLCLSTECGFATPIKEMRLTPELQWAKIHLVEEIAADVW